MLFFHWKSSRGGIYVYIGHDDNYPKNCTSGCSTESMWWRTFKGVLEMEMTTSTFKTGELLIVK